MYLDLLEQRSPSADDLNKLLRRTDATHGRMVEMELISTDATGLELRNWRDETRQAYAKAAVENRDTTATTLDRAHVLRNVYEQGSSCREYLEEWDGDELQALCEDLARVTGDEIYLRMLGADVTLEELGAD